MILMLLWESEDITISSLNKGTVNFRNELHGFIGISLLSALYSIGMAVLGISGLHIPPFLVIYSHNCDISLNYDTFSSKYCLQE